MGFTIQTFTIILTDITVVNRKGIVGLTPGESFMSESIYVVCTKDKVPMLHNLPKLNEQPSIISKDSKSFFEFDPFNFSVS